MSSTYFKVPKLSNKIVVYLILIFWFIFAIFPIYWAITMSFKDSPHVYGKRPTYMPFVDFKPTVKAWVHLVGKSLPGEDQFIQMPVLGEKMRYMTNSIIVALSSSIITVIFGVMAGYALTRFEYTKWKNDDIAFFILSQRMFPPVALAMPFFLLFTWVRLIDKLPSLIIVYAIMNMPIVTWIVKEFFTDVPKELEEAAMVDGATRWKALFRIIWNEFLIALTLTFKTAKTLPVGMAGLTTLRGPLYWDIAANSLVIMIPPLIVTVFANKYIIRGLALGAVKQ
jgi:multiple sugar transport system permease protein